MPVKSLKPYPAIHRDTQSGYGPVQMIYVCWEGHMLFSAPAALVGPPEAPLRDLLDGQLKTIIQIDPDASQVNWDELSWYQKGEKVDIDLDKSLADNGLKHKHQITFRTPGVNTVCGVAA